MRPFVCQSLLAGTGVHEGVATGLNQELHQLIADERILNRRLAVAPRTSGQFHDVVHKQYVKKFGKLGEAVVKSNMEVMRQGFDRVQEIPTGALAAADRSTMRGKALLPMIPAMAAEGGDTLLLAEHGHDASADLLGDVDAAAAEAGNGAIGLHCDVRDPDSCAAVVEATVSAFGGLDSLVYATAIDVLVRDLDIDLREPRQAMPRLRNTLAGLSLGRAADRVHGNELADDVWVRHLIGLDTSRGGVAVAPAAPGAARGGLAPHPQRVALGQPVLQ